MSTVVVFVGRSSDLVRSPASGLPSGLLAWPGQMPSREDLRLPIPVVPPDKRPPREGARAGQAARLTAA